jgi:exopolysaccharide biosynthesis WecB/TagA/CpsF family protein
MTDPSSVRIFGIDLARRDPDEALAAIRDLFEKEGTDVVAYANAHTLNLVREDPAYGEILRRAALVLNDGVGVQLAARMRGQRFPANLNGSDLNPRILELAAERGWKVFFLGGAEGVAQEAADRLAKRIRGLTIVGTHHGYLTDHEDAVRLVRAAQTDLLMVAMGNPEQEKWLHNHLAATGARIGIGVGAFFDFTAGRQRRAPAWMNRWGLEWVHRLLRDPGRMWRRYIVGNPVFLWRAWRMRRADISGAR